MALLCEYGFNEGSGTTAADSSGNGRNLTASHSTNSWDAAGKNGSGARYEHVGAMGPNTAQSTYTVMGWTKRTGSWTVWAGPLWGNPSAWFQCQQNDSFNLGFWDGSFSHNWGIALAQDIWTHLAFTNNSGSKVGYINGVQIYSSGSGATTVNFSSTSSWVAGGPTSVAGPFDDNYNGICDEVRIFDATLTQADIQAWMNTPVGPGGAPPPRPRQRRLNYGALLQV